MRIRPSVAGVGIALLVWAVPLVAHHSFAAQYDAQKPVERKGVITKVEWTNPHVRFYIDVKDDKGGVASWNFELASPNILVRNGWGRNTLKVGEEVTVTGFLGRSSPVGGPTMAIAGGLIAADGKKLFASSAADLGR